jgi:hypothetical protein
MSDSHAFAKQLAEEFPSLYPEPPLFECPAGWFPLLRDFSRDLYDLVGDDISVDVYAKEKYAMLHLHVVSELKSAPRDECIQCGKSVLVNHDIAAFCPHCGTKTPPPAKKERIRALKEHYESKSRTICQHCGAPGTWFEVRHWEYTLCAACVMSMTGGNLLSEATSLLQQAATEGLGSAEWQQRVQAFLTRILEMDSETLARVEAS